MTRAKATTPEAARALDDVAATGPTLQEVMPRFRRWARSEGLRPATINTYLPALGLLDRFLAEVGHPRTLRAIRREHLEAWVEWLQQRPGRRGGKASPAWVSLQYRSLLTFWRWAVERDEIDASPAAKMKAPKVDAVQKQPLGAEEIDRILRTCRGRSFENRRDRAIIRVLMVTGLRRQELASLTHDSIDFARGRLLVTAAGSKARRPKEVALDDEALEALDAYLSVRGRHPLADRTPALWLGVRKGPGGKPARPQEDDNDAALPPHGMKGDGIRQMIERRARQAGITRPVGVHVWRHTAATAAAVQGWSEREMMAQFGWEDRGMPRHYSRTAEADVAASAVRNRPLWGKR